ncbi:MAG TPA: sigma-70 family RNA polymerase sigma factor [Candidatus Bathyarchaeia archaeon]|nr:sigma-70 family RNA polymerase sigma factor [Candidatus Bathyarchaeia archaeon]
MQSEGPAESADDDEIVGRVQQGDRQAFAVLVARYQRMVFALALRMTGDRNEAEDVTQTSFMNAFRRLADFRGEASFKTWIYGIALNECRMVHRRARGDLPLDQISEPPAYAGGGHPLDRVVLRKLVARLPDKQRAALTLRVCEDLSFREIGALIGASEASAKVNYFHALKRLRGWLAAAAGVKQPSPGEPGPDRGGIDP